MDNIWDEIAFYLEKEFGAYVNWTEEFYICPNCDEPIYKEDFDSLVDFGGCLCPVCEWEGEE